MYGLVDAGVEDILAYETMYSIYEQKRHQRNTTYSEALIKSRLQRMAFETGG